MSKKGDVRAIILAAGRGKRLRPLTDKVPKCLLEVANIPLIEYQIRNLLENGIEDIVICAGYKRGKIKIFCQKIFPSVNIKIVENADFLDTNNMYSLYLCRQYLDRDIILMNGDVIFDEAIIRKLRSESDSCVCVDRKVYAGESMKIVVEKGFVRDISKAISPAKSYGVSIDVYKINEKDLAILNLNLQRIIEVEEKLNQWTEVLLQKLFQKGEVLAKPLDIGNSKWVEIDTYDDLNAAEQIFNKKLQSLKNKKLFFVDGDGTLFIGNNSLIGGKLFWETVKNKGRMMFFVTNNSSKTVYGHQKKLREKGFNVKLKEIIVSTDALIEFLIRNDYKKIYLLANNEVSKYFEKEGFIIDGNNPDCVILTYDDEITYQKLKKATLLINKNVPYYATHIDKSCPTEEGNVPDIGSYIELLKATTGKNPLATFGKPSLNIISHTLKENGLELKDVVMIGDRLYTDIKMGENNDLTTVLVLSGETRREDLVTSKVQPNIVIENLEQLAKYIQ